MQDPNLWSRIETHLLVPREDKEAFVSKLMQTEHWTRDFTLGVMEEYRRFIYLTQISENEVTPSIPIDAVWHLHMTYTRDYWEVLCDNILGKKLHHLPLREADEMLRFENQYSQTRNLYEHEFRKLAPLDYWPTKHGKKYVLASKVSLAISAVCFVVLILGQDMIPEAFRTTLIVLFGGFGVVGLAFGVFTGFIPGSSGQGADCGGADCGGGGCGGD